MNTGKFENDFIFDIGKNQIHALNIVSPGWTSCLAIGDLIADLVEKENQEKT